MSLDIPLSDDRLIRERESLANFYNATGGAEWTNNDLWLTEEPVEYWYGVRYHRIEGFEEGVLELNLQNNGLKGPLPLRELGELEFLEELRLHGNQLSGEIPPEVGNISRLEVIDFSGNVLTGEIPPELATVPRLYLQDNNLSGQIPSRLGTIISMRALYLGGNRFDGCIPEILGSIPNNDFLRVGLDFCGEGPLVAPGSTVEALVALYNATSGERWSDDTNWMNSTQSFAHWYGIDDSSGELHLKGNNLSGELPPELVNLQYLRSLDLSDNHLMGEIPSGLGSIKALAELDLGGNRIDGQIPAELGNLLVLKKLGLNGNLSFLPAALNLFHHSILIDVKLI